MNTYYTRLSFEKLESFDMQKSSLSSFVLIRNSLISALTKQQQYNNYQSNSYMMDYEEEVEEEKEEQVEQVWLDSCFHQLDHQEQEDDSEEEDMPLSPQDDSEEEDMPLSPQDDSVSFFHHHDIKKKPTFYINEEEEDEEEDALVCYDIPFRSLNAADTF
jgi:hypothetical protein